MNLRKLNIGDLDLDEYTSLRSLSKDDGYMAMYLDLCIQARAVHKRTDFICDIVAAEEDDEIIGWAMAQNLLYRYENFVELNIFVDKHFRGQGAGTRIIKHLLNRGNYEMIAWARDEQNIALYKKFKDDILILDMKEYEKSGKYIPYIF